MDEMKEMPETAETEVSDADLAAFDDDWSESAPDEGNFDLNDDLNSDEDTAESEGTPVESSDESTDEPENSDAPDNTDDTEKQPTEESAREEGHQLYTLKFPSGERQCTLEEVLTLANKGLDYDGVRQDRDRLREYESFLRELAAPSNYSVQELVDTTRAKMLMAKKQREGVEMSEMDALTAIQRDRAAAAAEEQTRAATQAETKKQEMISAFLAEFPHVNASEIPPEVWNTCRETGDLAGAYRKYANDQKDSEISRLKAEIETLKQNQKNKDRSTGSQKSVGAATPQDPFDEGWNSV